MKGEGTDVADIKKHFGTNAYPNPQSKSLPKTILMSKNLMMISDISDTTFFCLKYIHNFFLVKHNTMMKPYNPNPNPNPNTNPNPNPNPNPNIEVLH